MGVNNRQRRAAKRRKRNKERGGGPTGPRDANSWHDNVAAKLADVVTTVIREFPRNRGVLAYFALVLLGGAGSSLHPWISAPYITRVLTNLTASLVRHGWLPSDLAEMSRRQLSPRHVPVVAYLLSTEIEGRTWDYVSSAWRNDLASIGSPEAANLHTVNGMELALGLVAVFSELPPIPTLVPPPGAPPTTGPQPATADVRVLSRVRSLLAKAESTEFPEEAEALSAKAQELISRYALDRLSHRLDHDAEEPVTARRLWIDPPYVFAKGALVNVVADANRCRAVISEQLGFVTLFGEASDLDAVELLATSLLVQASTAMLRYGRQYDVSGTSRTTSFRRSFMTSYAARIGERLAEANRSAEAATARAGELVPLLQRQEKHIDGAMEAMFPDMVTRSSTVTNGYGWAAGRAAADRASLRVHSEIAEVAS